ncbi:MAG: cyclophilin-like fold protein [Candidatus Polarisedimenticolia bacterium]
MASERALRVEADGVRLYAVLATGPTADAVWEALPLSGKAEVWGEEVYFNVPLRIPAEAGARREVRAGEIGYWPEGPAIALFFGRTPASTGDEPVAASPVNVFARLTGDARRLARVRPGGVVTLTSIEG